ncbi:MAG: carbamoyltransferase HypF [Candidatus Syntrophonatronum acetioxidans]|uniref:Carbamoyltransferase n=1 Tax=Candidatus Syntrophonatronum acetioxidans TaxID=1795816 RepID=A0A424YDW5_9FIRM|nr:MAG: carbamoyltransferase HypF [Candidatus Syntrophonatronum acetioxidans]
MAQGYEKKEKFNCYRLTVKGIVQGVGFRPFVFNLAGKYGIKGTVLNSSRGVIIEIQGEKEKLELFCQELVNNPPRLSVINDFKKEEIPCKDFEDFTIIASEESTFKEALVPPDISCCEDCQEDMLNPKDRHYLYPFTNCTNCGPRFTLTKDIPYDRDKTSMSNFNMCEDCYRDYHDPGDRRFHAQPVACPACGPQASLADKKGSLVRGNWLDIFWDLLRQGKVFAVKSLGGFHLACDALNIQALNILRKRKNRPFKPFAVMIKDLETVRKYCYLNEAEEGFLTSFQAPIVILKKKGNVLPPEIAPGLNTLGVMLPYTPLHFLLFNGPFEVLIMTSANWRDLPLTKDNHRASIELEGIADYFLWHNRDIINRCDDSLLTVIGGSQQMYRRSRGYVPQPIIIPTPDEDTRDEDTRKKEVVLAMGGEMKNTFCLLTGNQAILSQYIGEMGSLETEEHFRTSLEHFKRFYEIEPEILAYDMHPGYRSSALAIEMKGKVKYPIQHHHAHMASCMAENRLKEPVIGLILDGTGYGSDGHIWGFEILKGDYLNFQREYHLAYMPLPGGEKAVEQPWRMAVSYLHTFLEENKARQLAEKRFGKYGKELQLVLNLLDKKFNCPLASSCGRLFDAVSAFLGVCENNTYEGQAAIELGEMLCNDEGGSLEELNPYPYEFRGKEINPSLIWQSITEDILKEEDRVYISRRFHDTLVAILSEAARKVYRESGIKKVVLSGGVWHNRYLLVRVKELLEREGYEVFFHHKVPPNDGGISLGQAAIAFWRWKNHVSGSSRQSNNN